MVLPTGINKAAGLRAAFKDLRLSAHNAVGVGDAENDHALLSECEVGVAVDNALPMLKDRADWVTAGARGEGVIELVEAMLASDLRELEPRLTRAEIEIGHAGDDPVTVHAYGRRLLLCGTSGSGKSTLTTGLLERLVDKHYQFCLIDPEGDYAAFEDTILVGDEQTVPKNDEIVELLVGGDKSVVVSLLGVPIDQRSAFFSGLLARLLECRTRWGRPHWIAVDEAHHMLPEGELVLTDALEQLPAGLLLVTVHPERLAAQILREVDTVLVVGDNPGSAFESFARASGTGLPQVESEPLAPGEALIWTRERGARVVRVQATPARAERHRHRRKYAAGALGEDKSFYFRGPRGALNLRAHNLALFLQIADGVDDETWLHHLHRHDYSHWLREAIKNPELAEEVRAIEGRRELDARSSRRRIRDAIDKIYTLPA
jgi:hypothetical protein